MESNDNPFDQNAKKPEPTDSTGSGTTSSAEKLASESAQIVRQSKSQASPNAQERQYPPDPFLQYPVLNAVSARAVYFGVQGKLFPSMDQITKTMLNSGPVGQAAVTRMENLAQKGWTFGALTPSDPMITRQYDSLAKRLGYSVILGGYHDAAAGRISHNAITSFGHTIMGFSNGANIDAAEKYIHELAHGRNAQSYERFEASASAKTALKEAPAAVRAGHAKGMIEEEIRALFAQVAANSSQNHRPVSEFLAPHTRGIGTVPAEAAVREKQMGNLIREVWPYDGPKSLTAKEANQVASAYIKSTYGELFENGKLNPRAELAIAREIAELPVNAPLNGSTLDGSKMRAVGEATFSSRALPYLSRGGQALGSMALAFTVSDLRTQFGNSYGSGIGRTVSVGSDWAGFEAGLSAGTHIGKFASASLMRLNPKLAMLAAPVSALGTGILGSEIMHRYVSVQLEQTTKKAIDNLLD